MAQGRMDRERGRENERGREMRDGAPLQLQKRPIEMTRSVDGEKNLDEVRFYKRHSKESGANL